jgi:hypothetical protein
VHPSSRPGNFEALSAFVAILAEGAHQGDGLLEQLAERLVSALDAQCATVGLDHQGHLQTAVAHPDTEQALCDLLHEVAASPATTAFTDRTVLAVADVGRQQDRWPGYSARAVQLGMRSVLSVPLQAGPEVTGAVSVIAPARDWREDEIVLAQAMTDLVAMVVSIVETGRRNAARAEQLQHALDSRVVVEQAKGVLAAAEAISVDQAYARLRAFARSHNAKVGDVAQAVVRLGLRPGPDDERDAVVR